jgi:hypothetical protein
MSMIGDLIIAAVAFAAGNLVGWFARIVWQTRALTRDIEEKVDDLTNRMDERGFMSLERARDVVVVLMLLVVIYAAVMSSRASDKVADQQERLEADQAERARSVACLSSWAHGFAETVDARAARLNATTKARDKMDDAAADVFAAITAVLASDGAPADVAHLRDTLDRHHRAYAAVAAAVEAQADTGQANPYPDWPQRCYER